MIPPIPPIPPNCDILYEPVASRGPYWIINNLAVTSICLEDTDKDDRKIIAAVARCAWLDEAATGPKCLEQLALNNAAAWKLWGEQK